MKYPFQPQNFTTATLALIEQMNQILGQYAQMGYSLTVRQLYYQLVSRNVVPNSQRSYKRVVNTAGNARNAGLMDWSAIVDRARGVHYLAHWEDPTDATNSLIGQFRVNRWINQPIHVEVMLEKDALAGVLAPVCEELDVRLHPNKGYSSLSKMYRHGIRLYNRVVEGKELHVIYCGDHDPSGMDMDRDIMERLELYSFGSHIHFTRVALTMEQIEEHNPPPQWAKATDSRSPAYVAQYGEDVWELDALEPQLLAQVVKEEVEDLRDEDLYQELIEMEAAMREDMEQYAGEWRERLDDGEIDYVPDWYKELVYS